MCTPDRVTNEEHPAMAHHGNTPAAWTGVLVILVGFVVGGIGLVIGSWPMFWVGVVDRRRSARSSARSCRRWASAPSRSPRSATEPRHDRRSAARHETRSRGQRLQGPLLLAGGRAGAPASLLHLRDPHQQRQLRLLPVAAAHRHLLPGLRRPARGQRPDQRRPRRRRVEQPAVRRLAARSGAVVGRARSWTAGGAGSPGRSPAARAAGRSRSSRLAVVFAVVRNLPFGAWLAP